MTPNHALETRTKEGRFASREREPGHRKMNNIDYERFAPRIMNNMDDDRFALRIMNNIDNERFALSSGCNRCAGTLSLGPL